MSKDGHRIGYGFVSLFALSLLMGAMLGPCDTTDECLEPVQSTDCVTACANRSSDQQRGACMSCAGNHPGGATTQSEQKIACNAAYPKKTGVVIIPGNKLPVGDLYSSDGQMRMTMSEREMSSICVSCTDSSLAHRNQLPLNYDDAEVIVIKDSDYTIPCNVDDTVDLIFEQLPSFWDTEPIHDMVCSMTSRERNTLLEDVVNHDFGQMTEADYNALMMWVDDRVEQGLARMEPPVPTFEEYKADYLRALWYACRIPDYCPFPLE